jgi:hypothetical protein
MIAPEFRPSSLESSVRVLNSNTENLLNRLATFAGGPEFDVHPFMNLHAIDNICGELWRCSSQRTLTVGLTYTMMFLTTNLFFFRNIYGSENQRSTRQWIGIRKGSQRVSAIKSFVLILWKYKHDAQSNLSKTTHKRNWDAKHQSQLRYLGQSNHLCLW